MEMEKIKKLVGRCMEYQDCESYDLLEEELRNSSFSLEKLYSLKEKLRDFCDEQTTIVNIMYLEDRKATEKLSDIEKKFKILDSYDEDRVMYAKRVLQSSSLVMLSAMAYKVATTSSYHELLMSFLSVITAVAVAGPIAYNQKRLALINKLEKFGDLDYLMMMYYDAFERDKGCYDAMDLADKKSRVADFCEVRVDNVIYDVENEEAIQYVRA